MKAKSFSALQKSYDQAYLTSSTAAYYETLSQPAEALENWRRVLTQLYPPPRSSQKPKTATEASLLHSLQRLREQAEDRSALLAAIIESSKETPGSELQVPPMSPPILPDRPPTAGATLTPLPHPSQNRSPSPGPARMGNGMLLSTLRTGKKGRRESASFESLRKVGPKVAAQAATLAWSSISKARGESLVVHSASAPNINLERQDQRPEMPRKPSSSGSFREEEPELPGVRARPQLGRVRARAQSSMLPFGSPTHDELDDHPLPPPPPPHRVSVRRRMKDGEYGMDGAVPPPLSHRAPVRRKPLPESEYHDGDVPPPLPPKITPQHPAKPERPRRIQTGTPVEGGYRLRSSSDSTLRGEELSPASTPSPQSPDDSPATPTDPEREDWDARIEAAIRSIGRGADPAALQQVASEIVVKGDEVHWEDVAGLEGAKSALKEAVVYPFLRPDLFSGLREPAKGMLLFGPPGTGKTMLARAVATESRSTFFSISASSLTSKYLGESEKLVRALFALAKALAPSIIFVDEIDSLLSSRQSGENEATRRIKTEFLIQWSDLARAAAGKDPAPSTPMGDPTRVLVLAATNLPWAIDEAARRRFARRQYIPLPEAETRRAQLQRLLMRQKHGLDDEEMERLVELTEGFSGSDITALAKDAAMGPLRALGDGLLSVRVETVRGIGVGDFVGSLQKVRPSVSKEGLREFEEWAERFGERV